MPSLLLRANSPLFETDLRQLGHLFFPGEEIAVLAPTATGIEAPWQVDVVALPLDAGALWRVTVCVEAPQRSDRAQEELTMNPAESPRTFEHRLRRLVKGLVVDLLGELRGFRPPWGVLTGVRPTKLVHQMLDQGRPNPVQTLQAEYRLSAEKAQLLVEVAQRQRPFLHQDPRAIGIYVGIPFCPTICSFCSFSIYPMLEHRDEVPAYLAALGREMELIGEAIAALGLRVESIYFGGGTPTSPRDEDFSWMLQKAATTLLKGQQPVEYTVEGGRPETMTRAKLDAMAAHGVTRISINPQTTVQATLLHLGRIHTTEKFYRAYDLARQHPHPFIINCDTIVGLPGEGPDEVAYTLRDMRRLAPDNLTVHTLAIKRGSRLHQQSEAAAQTLRSLAPAEAEALVREAEQTARAMGQHPYYLYRQKFMVGSLENVGYSLPGMESLYNIQMLSSTNCTIGLGAGATSHLFHPRGWLFSLPRNPNDPTAYVGRMEELARYKVDRLRLLFGGLDE